jgi:hypothetical protein
MATGGGALKGLRPCTPFSTAATKNLMNTIITLFPDTIWNVIYKDEGNWRVGLYKPDSARHEDISILEKHTCPELFVCQQGRMGLVVKEGPDETIMELDPGQAVLVKGYHNGFAIDKEGYFLVVERTAFTTEYIERDSGRFIKKVEVK